LVSERVEVLALRRTKSASADEVESVVSDLLDPDQLKQSLERVRPDLVFHLAGVTTATRDRAAMLPTFYANVASTVNLLTALTEVGCRRVVLAGSLEEPQEHGVPSSPYAASKWAASMYGRTFWQLYRTPVTVARIFMVYGPGQHDVKKVIPHTILSLLCGKELRYSSGRREVDWVYVDDVARGLVAVSRAPKVDGEVVDLGTGILTSVRHVVERIVEMVETTVRPQFGALPDRANEQVCRADVAGSEALVGWRPVVPLQEGLRRTVAFYRQSLRCGDK
jgi:nucleoside-diphosphate-sugar epimerase